MGDAIAATLGMTIQHFRRNHQQSQFVVPAPKEGVRRAVEAVHLGAHDDLVSPMQSADRSKAGALGCTAIVSLSGLVHLIHIRDRLGL
jgi:hypothetical protein